MTKIMYDVSVGTVLLMINELIKSAKEGDVKREIFEAIEKNILLNIPASNLVQYFMPEYLGLARQWPLFTEPAHRYCLSQIKNVT